MTLTTRNSEAGTLLTSAFCEGYRAFSQPTNLQLANLTVLFGKNNSGKTTLARLPIFAIACLAEDSRNYATHWRDIRFGSTFWDLASSDQVHPSLSIGVTLSGQDVRTTYQSFTAADTRATVDIVALEVNGYRLLRQDPNEVLFGGMREPSWRQALSILARPDRERVERLRQQASALLSNTSHVSSIRPAVQAVYSQRDPASWETSEGPYLIASSRDLEEKVSDWCSEHLDGKGVSVEQAAFAFRLMIRDSSGTTNLANSGRGTQSLISLIIMLHGITMGMHKPDLLVVEEPEAHVHPSAHGALTDLLLECSRHTQVVVETHSENLILRLRRRIAEGLDSSSVSLQYIDMDHDLKTVDIDDQGGASHWPSGVFEYDIAEAEAIVEAKLAAMEED